MPYKRTDNLTEYLRDVVMRARRAEDEADAIRLLDVVEAEMREHINAERLDAASRLAGWLAHRINNPLGAISGNAQLLARRLERDVGAESLAPYLRYIEAIQTQTERSAEITAELLEFTKPRDADMRGVSVHDVAKEAIELARYGRERTEVVLDTDSLDSVPHAWTDKDLLVRALYEVIVNAVQASGEDGRVTVRATTGPSNEAPEWIRIAIADTGPQIPPEVLRRMFDPFFSTREKARGIGLTAALAILRQLNGSIEVTETGKNGATVTLQVPSEVHG